MGKQMVERIARALCEFENKIAREQCGPDAVQYRYEDWHVEFDRKALAVLERVPGDLYHMAARRKCPSGHGL